MRFDSSGLEKAFNQMKESASKSGKILAKKQGNFFVRIARKVSFQHAPDPIEILDLGLKLGGRLRRKKGVTVMQEIGRRISKIGTLARGWRLWKYEEGRGYIRIWIRDNVGYSKTVDDKQELGKQAADIVRKSFKKNLERLAKKITTDFAK